jgi:hypothetical protein
MRFAGWYLKIAAGGAAIGAAMELFMIHTGFCASNTSFNSFRSLPFLHISSNTNFCCLVPNRLCKFGLLCAIHLVIFCNAYCFSVLLYATDEKVTMLESEKRAWESSPEAQAMREALNPWHKNDEQREDSHS